MEFKIDYIINDVREFVEMYIVNDESGENQNDINTKDEFHSRKRLSHVIANLHASDQAIIFSKLKELEKLVFIRDFSGSINEDIVLFLETPLLYEMFGIVGLERFSYFVAMLEFDEAIEVLEKLDEEKRNNVMKMLPFKKRIQLKRSLSYPEYSCGRNMSVDYLSVPYWWTIARTKKYIKDSKTAIENEDGTIFVTDEERNVIGTVSIIKLLNEEPTSLINNCTDKDIITIKAYDSIPDIAHLYDQHDLDIIPVTNKHGNIIGVLELSEVVEYLQESSEKQVLRSVGIFENKSNTIFGIASLRFVWLIIDFCTAIVASYFISLFEDSIAKVTTLAVLMPIVSTMGGNCGSQTSTVIIRSIFVGNITRKQMITEISISLINGIGLAIICFLGVWLFYSNIILGAIFGVSVLITLFMAGICGVFIPLTLKKFKVDPPVGTSILLTTFTDICGFVTILLLGTIFLIK